ncbi:MAG: aminopeptidase P family protein [Methanomicrobiales archaeon]|nr:aminopeptidase P family protein [Methanomicrobiales archaeon]
MHARVPPDELEERMRRFITRMDADNSRWECAALFGRINLYYFTGTMQDGMLLIPRDGDAVLWVRRSYERALDESSFPRIEPMNSYRDAAQGTRNLPDTVYLETELVPLALFRRLQKHFPFSRFRPLDLQVSKVRAVKSAYELSRMEQAGRIHERVLEECVPLILTEGMSEAEFGSSVYSVMVREGHQGIVRFGGMGIEIEVGQLGFGESSLYPTSFDGPGGCYGLGPAAPVLGSRERKLANGDLVFIDNACGVEGYQTDKTMTYMFGSPVPDNAIAIHHQCVDLQNEMAALLKPGTVPSEIYFGIMERLSPGLQENFMGYGARKAQFLGHGVGLLVDEIPVIARGFDEPLQEGMTIALEPKYGVRGVGMVGIENTFVVTPGGGRSITGTSPGLIPVW